MSYFENFKIVRIELGRISGDESGTVDVRMYNGLFCQVAPNDAISNPAQGRAPLYEVEIAVALDKRDNHVELNAIRHYTDKGSLPWFKDSEPWPKELQ